MTSLHCRLCILVSLVGIPSLLSPSRISAAVSTVFVETMGSVAATTTIAAHEAANGFDNDALTFTGTGDVRNTQASTGYPGASGLANIFLTNTGGDKFFQIAGVNTTGLVSLQLSFGIFKSTNAGTGSDLIVEVSSDGTTYVPLSYPALPTGTGTVAWYLRTASGTIPATGNLRIRFRNTGASATQYRIDDVSLDGETGFVGADNAADAVYADGWASGDNGGFGFGVWTINDGGGGHFVASSTNNCAGGSSGIDTGGLAWGMFHDSGAAPDAFRPFAGALDVDQTFAIDIDNGFIDSGTVGLGLQTLGGGTLATNRLEVFFVGGNSNYTIQHGATATDSGVPFTCNGLRIEVMLTDPDTATVTLSPRGGTPVTMTGLSLGGVAGTGVDQLRLFDANGVSGSSYDLFFNSILVTCSNAPTTFASNDGPVCAGSTLTLMATGAVTDVYNWIGPSGFSSTNQNPVITNIAASASGTYTVTRIAMVQVSVSPQVLINDPYDPVSTNSTDVNLDIGRQSGTLASLTYTQAVNGVDVGPDVHHQVGNSDNGHDPAHLWISADATGFGSVSLEHNFVENPGLGGVMLVSFDVDPVEATSSAGTALDTSWAAITLGAGVGGARLQTVDDANTHLGLLFRGNGDFEGFNGSLSLGTGTYTGSPAGLHHIDIMISDPVDGDPWDGTNPSFFDVFVDGGSTAVFSFTNAVGYTSNYITLLGDSENGDLTVHDFDNFEVSIVPTNVVACSSLDASTLVSVFENSVTASNNSPVCEGQTLNLFASGNPGDSYDWTGPDGFISTDQNPAISNVTTSATGTYSVIRTVPGCGPSPAATTDATVNAIPATAASDNSPICEGETLLLTATGNSGDLYSWSGPNGFSSTNQNPSIVGATVSNAGTYTVTRTVNGCTSVPVSTIPTINPTPSISASNNGPVCAGADLQLSAVGTGSFLWTGPLGFTSSDQNPVISNAQPNNSGLYCVTVTDVNGCTNQTCTAVTVTDSPVPLPETLPFGFLSTPYSQTVTATGGTPPYTFAVTAGSLPTGLTLSSAGVLSGIPSLNGVFTFTITVTDVNGCTGSREYTIQIGCSNITIDPPSLPTPETGIPYSQVLTPDGGAPPYVFIRTAGSLPQGLSLLNSGTISGTPTQVGSFQFKVSVLDTNGCVGQRFYTVTVRCPFIGVLPDGLPVGEVGVSYSANITAIIPALPGSGSFTFAQTAGSLPEGMTLSSNGLLSGTPTSGSSEFTVTATDLNTGCTGDKTFVITLAIPPPSLPVSITSFLVGQTYNQSLAVSGGRSPYSFAVTGGTLPAGVGLSGTGSLSGTPSAVGAYNFTITVTDADGRAGSGTYAGTVACPTVSVGPSSIPDGTVGVSYSQVLTGSGGASPHSLAVSSGSLPSGFSLSGAGALTGTPTATGDFTFEVTATNGSGCSGRRSYTLHVGCPGISVGPAALPAATHGLGYSQSVSASGGAGPHNFAVTSGTLPAGLTLSAAGVLSGSPTQVGDFTVEITATDANGCSAAHTFVITVGVPTAKSAVVTDSDGDTALVKLSGAGSLLTQDAPNGKRIVLFGTDATSALTIKVTRGSQGDGRLNVDSIAAAGSLKSINAATADLVGAGIDLGGALGSLKIGAIRNTHVSVTGNLGTLRAVEATDALIAAGFTPADAANPMAGGVFTQGVLIKSVNIRNFTDSVIAAAQVGKVGLGSVQSNPGGRAYGVLAQQSIGSVAVANPRFKWNPAGAADQAVGDFHVQH